MPEWRADIAPKRVRLAGSPNLALRLCRDRLPVADVYPVESRPGLQIATDVLDFERLAVGLPDGEGGQVIYVARLELVESVATADVPGRWLGLDIRPEHL